MTDILKLEHQDIEKYLKTVKTRNIFKQIYE